ncbi:hypothetical protein LTR56_005560 [Elasticomyces elasticus]|nr:hypothetical protein LTR22_017147 [Elasticomyces elasticus]KAK3651752.1 hypothetical protein LTR56_005560 [Elasticomyces elasticus]KAK4913343.1 hypothetical protein LTR49_018324 [Elasticomyces elasticus]KAK5769149.1 hypothetical protein LTS12_000500 [Elasticomyces elasticus]
MSKAPNQAACPTTDGPLAQYNRSSTTQQITHQGRRSLTQANLATHNANHASNVDRQGNVHRWLANQSEMMSRREGPTPAVWQELVQRDPLAADIDAAVKEAIKSSKTRK